MFLAEIRVTLRLKGPLLTQSSSPGAPGIDAPAARRTDQRCYFPGSLIKGKLREAWLELCPFGGPSTGFDPQIDLWLGPAPEDPLKGHSPGPSQRAGKLHFTDFVEPQPSPEGRIHRIRMDGARGAADEGALLVIESPFASGQEVSFEGYVRAMVTGPTEAHNIAHHLKYGLRWIPNLGAERTVGFGRLTGVEVAEPVLTGLHPATAAGSDRIPLVISPSDAFVIVKSRISDNLFESDTVIPGGVIKGAIATMWRQALGLAPGGVTAGMDTERPELCEYFHLLRITHAFPSLADSLIRPVQPPLSLVSTKRGWRDVILSNREEPIGGEAPCFAVDWKEKQWIEALNGFGWPPVRKEIRVRTAMDPTTRRARDEALFGHQRVLPQSDTDPPREIVWLAAIDLSRISADARRNVERQLRSLLSLGIGALGKTKTYSRVDLNRSFESVVPNLPNGPAQSGAIPPGHFIVTLQTDALLCDPARLTKSNGEQELFDAYKAVWSDLSNHKLELVRFFASHRLAGGEYLHHRFRGGGTYEPFLLTEAGSVFLLKAVDSDSVETIIEGWKHYGLDLPRWAKDRYGLHAETTAWQRCPYLPQNGYGEVAVNLCCHASHQPTEEDF